MAEPLISIANARQRVLDAAERLPTEDLEVEDALDRVLAADISAAGATAVVRQEDITLVDGAIDAPNDAATTIEIDHPVEAGANIREPGEDMRAGAPVLRAGAVLRAAELGAAVAAGAATVTVSRRPTVAVLSTGDELKAPGEPLGPGEIHNSNGAMLGALALHGGAHTTPPQRLPDDAQATEAGLGAALEHADVVIVTGGVSVGPHDHVKPALALLGVQERFWGVALQPGKPTWFGTRNGKLVFGLPGNPVSAAVTFSLFAHPAIQAMLGAPPHEPPAAEAALTIQVKRNPSREQAIRVRLQSRADATLATPNGPQGSHILSSLVGADALALIPRGDGELPAGTRVELAHLAS
jgi:molybdopterin molybdotransferase